MFSLHLSSKNINHKERPAVAEKRLSLTAQGKVRSELKIPYRDGTTYVIFEPLCHHDLGATPLASIKYRYFNL